MEWLTIPTSQNDIFVNLFGAIVTIGTTATIIVLTEKGKTMRIDETIKELKKIKRFSPFFLNKRLDGIIDNLEQLSKQKCGKCRSLTVRDDGVYYCNLYKCAKPWDGYCEKWRER